MKPSSYAAASGSKPLRSSPLAAAAGTVQCFCYCLTIPICHRCRSFGPRLYSESPSSDVQKSAEVPREKSSHSSLSMSTMSERNDAFSNCSSSCRRRCPCTLVGRTYHGSLCCCCSQPTSRCCMPNGSHSSDGQRRSYAKGCDKNRGSSPFVQRRLSSESQPALPMHCRQSKLPQKSS